MVPKVSEESWSNVSVTSATKPGQAQTHVHKERLRLIVLRWIFFCRVDGTMIMETSTFTWATKALEKLKEEKKQMGLDFKVHYYGRLFEGAWLLGGT